MNKETAIKKAKDGEFEFIYDIKEGNNEVRYQTPSGKWKEKTILIESAPSKERTTKTIEETKLGVTMVLSKEDCYRFGFEKGTTTKQAIKELRIALKLEAKEC